MVFRNTFHTTTTQKCTISIAYLLTALGEYALEQAEQLYATKALKYMFLTYIDCKLWQTMGFTPEVPYDRAAAETKATSSTL